MRMPYWLKDILTCVLVVLIGFAVIWMLFSIGSIFGPDRGNAWSKERIDWNYGSIVLNDAGDDVAYSAGFTALYTKDVIPCTAYRVNVSLPAGVNLKVYYFDKEDKYLGVREINDERYLQLPNDDEKLPEGIAGIRLCMLPSSGSEIFKAPLFNVGNIAMKWKYSGYVKLEITNSDKTTVDNVNGI